MRINKGPKKILIAIVAYEAERHITDVLNRIPKEVWNSPNFHVLLSDDASKDSTIEIAQQQFKKLGENYSILKLVSNQGYGGNQKVCYRFAITNGFDTVILLHGDGQYAPELIAKFVDILHSQDVQVILGSRMMNIQMARKGGMPYYKIIGNILLTRIQNYLCRSNLIEFHTGYRAYSTKFLKEIPFELNSDDFHFDTEILVQAFHSGAKICEFLIPTHYGDEICRVPGFKYAWNVILASIRFRLQRMGLLVSLKYPRSANQVYQNKLDDPNSTHSKAVKYLKKNNMLQDTSILDIGCGPGHISTQLKQYPVKVTGVDLYEPETNRFHEFIKMDLEQEEWNLDITMYNIVLLLDVIEHLSDPENFLLSLRNKMKGSTIPTIIISVPNIGFLLMRLNLLFGQFNYADRGILDITHKRFFTFRTFRQLLSETGYQIEEIHGVGIPFKTLGKSSFFKTLGAISAFLAKIYPSLFAFQVLAVVRPKLRAYQLIRMSQR